MNGVSLPMLINCPFSDQKSAIAYLQEEGVMHYFESAGISGQYAPDFADLARLYYCGVSRRVFTVLEFGVGWSTIALAAALHKNRARWECADNKPAIRNPTPFRVFSVDASEKWLTNAKTLIPDDLKAHVSLSYSEVFAGTFDSRLCHYYRTIPDVVPDFIYLDGPDPADVVGTVNGLSWAHSDRTLLAADILCMEPLLLPGTLVLIDGRVNNARFIQRNLQRHWQIDHCGAEDVTFMELQEPPLGRLNEQTLKYTLGNDYWARLETD